jgi:hypothetical protein
MVRLSSAIVGLAALAGSAGAAMAQPAAAAWPEHLIPQAQAVEHQENLERLAILSRRPGQVGAQARAASALFRAHNARESEYILPPLTLLPDIAEGRITPDMRWALEMADRVRADREVIFDEHDRMIAAMNDLAAAGQLAHDQEAVEFAKGAATDTLNDVEILEPAVLMIGDTLRARLGPAR